MTTTNTTADMQFIVQFPDTDQLSIGPFPSHETAQAFGETSVFHAIGARFNVVGVIAPRPDHTAKPDPVDTTRLLAALRAAKKGATEIQLAHDTGYALTAVRAALVAMKEAKPRAAFYVYENKGKVWHADDSVSGKAAALPLYRQEFPDFDYDLPAIPGMLDQSWHNDVSPSLVGNGFQLWCDYADIAKRETEGGDRFTLYRDLDGSIGDLIIASDNLDDILAAIETAKASA